MAQFAPQILELLERVREIEVETRRRRTTIWVVTVDGSAYVRSIRGSEGAWYRDLRREREGVVHVGRHRVPVRASAVRSDETLQRVSAAFRRKYARSPGSLASVVAPHTLAGTLRLEPAQEGG